MTTAALGVDVLKVTLHCFRHGGASHDFAVGARGIAEVQARGFWRAASSVRRYNKAGRIGLQLQTLGLHMTAHCEAEAQRAPSVFARNFAGP